MHIYLKGYANERLLEANEYIERSCIF